MDSRDIANLQGNWYEAFNEENMTATFIDLDGEEITVYVEYAVCPLCGGKGSHVNPSIDSHGISPEELYSDSDFVEDYFSGRYDIPCNQCKGKRVVPVPSDAEPHIKKLVEDKIAEDRAYAMERLAEIEMGY